MQTTLVRSTPQLKSGCHGRRDLRVWFFWSLPAAADSWLLAGRHQLTTICSEAWLFEVQVSWKLNIKAPRQVLSGWGLCIRFASVPSHSPPQPSSCLPFPVVLRWMEVSAVSYASHIHHFLVTIFSSKNHLNSWVSSNFSIYFNLKKIVKCQNRKDMHFVMIIFKECVLERTGDR